MNKTIVRKVAQKLRSDPSGESAVCYLDQLPFAERERDQIFREAEEVAYNGKEVIDLKFTRRPEVRR